MTVQATGAIQSYPLSGQAQAQANTAAIAIAGEPQSSEAFDQALTSVQKRYQVGTNRSLAQADLLPQRQSSKATKTKTSRPDRRGDKSQKTSRDTDRKARSRRLDHQASSSANAPNAAGPLDRANEQPTAKQLQDASGDPSKVDQTNFAVAGQQTVSANEQAEVTALEKNAADKGQTFLQLLQADPGQADQLLTLETSTGSDAQQSNSSAQPSPGQAVALASAGLNSAGLNNVVTQSFSQQLEQSSPATQMQSNALSPTTAVGSTGNPASLPATPASNSLASPEPVLQTADAQDQANVNRVVRSIANALQQRGGSITLRLQPEQMGSVRVAVQIDQGQVQAAILAQTESARSLLTHEIQQLRHALESQGLQVQRITVQTFEQAQLASGQEQGLDQSPSDGQSRGSFGQAASDQQTPFDSEPSEKPREHATFSQALNEVA